MELPYVGITFPEIPCILKYIQRRNIESTTKSGFKQFQVRENFIVKQCLFVQNKEMCICGGGKVLN